MKNFHSEPVFRLAHLSDLHFFDPSLRASQFFCKSWLGKLNSLVTRNRSYDHERLTPLIDLFEREKVHAVVISGDLTTTSEEKEFSDALSFTSELTRGGIQVFTLPGNHDQYTRAAFREHRFYHFFPSEQVPTTSTTSRKWNRSLETFTLKEDRVSAKLLRPNWWLITLDTAIATPWISSQGLFSKEQESHLKTVLDQIPHEDRIILANHYPFFESSSPRKSLLRKEALSSLVLQHPNIKLYLHGHTHRHCIADLRASGYPIIIDSGSTPHLENGGWNLLEVSDRGCDIRTFRWQEEATHAPAAWQASARSSFVW